MNVRVALIGCGLIGNKRLQLLPPGSVTVAVVFAGIVTVNRRSLCFQSDTTIPYAESYSTCSAGSAASKCGSIVR